MKRLRLQSFSPRRLLTRAFWLNPASLMLAVMLLVLLLYGLRVPFLELMELKTYDLRFLSRGPLAPSPTVALAVIDEKSLDAEGRWPWPRSKIAALIDRLSEAGAKVVGFDILFSEPDENSQVLLLDRLASQLDTLAIGDRRLRRFLSEQRFEADNDVALVKAIKRSRAPVVLGYFFHMDRSTIEYEVDQRETARRLRQLAGSRYPRVRRVGAGPADLPLIQAYTPQINLDIFNESAASSGYFSLQSDPDGVLRWMPLAIQAGDDFFPPLSVLSIWHYLDRPALTLELDRHGVQGITIGDRFVATDGAGHVLINYLGPPKTFPHHSATDILNGRVPAEALKDRIVLVGATAVATYDLRNTPFSPLYPGLEIHATVIDNILTGRFMGKPEWARLLDLLSIMGLSLVTGVVLTRRSPLAGTLFAVVAFAVYIFLARSLFVGLGVWLNLVYPLLALASVYLVLTVYYYVTEQRERKRIKGTFKQYVAEIVVEEMIKDPSRLRLGGEEKVLTVLFSDLEGFTTYSERHTPNEMTTMLAEYYDRVTEQIFLHRGTLKEYVGDELLAFFGAPVEEPQHAHRACEAALAMRDQTRRLADEWAAIGRPRIRARTGINTGPMVVGNLGSRYRFAYGVVGDHVNLGSRLEGLNKVYRTEIIIGENTARLVEPDFVLRELDMVRVIGRAQVVHIYELVARAGTELVANHEKALWAYAEGLEAYRKGMFTDALALFRQALIIRPEDGPSRALAQRCVTFEASPPDPWDGVYEQQFK